MRISVLMHGHLQSTSSVGQDELELTLPDSGNVRIRDLLHDLNVLEEEIRRVTMNGRAVRFDTNLRHRAKIDVYPKQRHGEKSRRKSD